MRSKLDFLWSLPFWGALALLLASQAFYLALSFSALHKLQLESSLVVERLLVEDLSRRLDLTVRTGRALHRYPRLAEEISRIRSISQAEYLMVTDVQGRVLGGQWPADSIFLPVGGAQTDGDAYQFERDGRLWLGRTIVDRQQQPAGFVYLTVSEADIGRRVRLTFQENQGVFLAAAGLSMVLLALILVWARDRIASGALSRARIYGLFLAPFLLGQLFFYAIGLGDIGQIYQEQNQQVAGQLARSLTGDLDQLIAKNVKLNDIPGLDEHLNSLKRDLPLVSSIFIIDREGALVAAGGSRDLYHPDFPQDDKLATVSRLTADRGYPAGRVEVWLSSAVVLRGWGRLILDNATMTLVAGLLLLELARLIILKLRPAGAPAPGAAGRPEAAGLPAHSGADLMRPLVFVALFALDMSLSFIPLKMAALNPKFMGLAPEILLSLPVSAEMGLAGLAMFGGGFLAGRLGGWRPLFLAGVLLAAVGYLLSGLAVSAGVYVLARGLAGLGYGALNIAAQIYVVSRTEPGRQGEALGDLFAGFFSGGLCGCAAGGLMADRLGFAPVFFVSAAIFVALSLMVFLIPKSAAVAEAGRPERTFSPGNLGRFLRSRAIWNLGLLSVLPAAMVLVGLINYFLPLHLASLGAGPAVISQLNVLFSLLVVFLGPRFGRSLDGSRRPYLYLVFAGLLAAAAFPPFLAWPTVAGAVAGMICLGISNAISENGQAAYLLSRPETALVGNNQALSLYNAVTRVGQVGGPLVVAAVLSRGGLTGLAWLGLLVALISLLFWALAPDKDPAAEKPASSEAPGL